MKRMFLLVVSLWCVITSSARAELVTSGVTDVTPFMKNAEEGRILMRLNFPTLAENAAIRRALLFFDYPAGADEGGVLPLRIYPVTTPWNAGAVDWEGGWTRPGGDFPEDLFARAEIELGRNGGTGIIDLTALVKEILEDGFVADGLLVTIDPNFGEGIRVADLAKLEGLASGRLEISSRAVPPRPRGLVEDVDSTRE